MGIGFAYVCPIACAAKWFPDKKGFINGIAVKMNAAHNIQNWRSLTISLRFKSSPEIPVSSEGGGGVHPAGVHPSGGLV
ncbi:unnamed protein product [marine sediment metagenome]|uniref:Uncharacterized protein n=1 Tax=marine sediment metagenome TaxID=412755 RepID=X1VKL9_9ZZZZ